jgi:hypothetical protein
MRFAAFALGAALPMLPCALRPPGSAPPPSSPSPSERMDAVGPAVPAAGFVLDAAAVAAKATETARVLASTRACVRFIFVDLSFEFVCPSLMSRRAP